MNPLRRKDGLYAAVAVGIGIALPNLALAVIVVTASLAASFGITYGLLHFTSR